MKPKTMKINDIKSNKNSKNRKISLLIPLNISIKLGRININIAINILFAVIYPPALESKRANLSNSFEFISLAYSKRVKYF